MVRSHFQDKRAPHKKTSSSTALVVSHMHVCMHACFYIHYEIHWKHLQTISPKLQQSQLEKWRHAAMPTCENMKPWHLQGTFDGPRFSRCLPIKNIPTEATWSCRFAKWCLFTPVKIPTWNSHMDNVCLCLSLGGLVVGGFMATDFRHLSQWSW